MVKSLHLAFPAKLVKKNNIAIEIKSVELITFKKNMYLHRVCFPSEASHVYFTKGKTISNAESKMN